MGPQITSAVDNQVQVVHDSVLCAGVNPPRPRNAFAADPADLFEVQRGSTPTTAWRVHTGLDQRPPRSQDPDSDFETFPAFPTVS